MGRQLETLAAALFEPDDIVELRCIRGRDIHQRWTPAGRLSSLAGALGGLNRQGYNIYFGPNPRREPGRSGDANVHLARCLFCDFDGVSAGDGCGRFEFVYNDIFLAGLPEPTLGIASGHGIHIYWRLLEPLDDLVVWRAVQAGLARRLGADSAIKNPERLMRLPGFVNTKYKPYQDCFICWSEELWKQLR
jgi:hypothetical protein